MKICHVCGAEYEDFVEMCVDCGAQLHTAEEVEEFERLESELEAIHNPVLVASCEDVITAEIFRDVLTDNGIAYTDDTRENAAIKVLFGGGLSAENVYVDESNFEKAKELYEQVLNAEPVFADPEETDAED